MKLYSNNNPSYRLEFIALIFFTLSLINATLIIMTGRVFFRPTIIFLYLFIIILVSTNALRVLITQFLGNLGGVCLLSFLFYYLVMAIGYPDTQISSDHISRITKSVMPFFLAGFVMFGKIELHSIHEFPKHSQSIRSILLNTPLIASLLFCLLVIALITSMFWSIRRADIFLIKNFAEHGGIHYQAFGFFALLTFIGVLKIIHYYLKQKKDYYITFCFIVICVWFVFSVSLALVGSNKGLFALVLILLMCIIYAKPKNYVIKHNKIRLKKLFIVLSILLFCGGASFYISGIELPYLKIFGYGDQTSLLKNQSLVDRIEIFMDEGIDQLFINPVFGNLGAEYIVGTPGRYIHSIISVQSHLGIIGSFLLLSYFIHRLYRLYANDGRSVLKMITPPIFFISLIGAFFAWPGLWFLIGALFAPRKDP